MPRSGWTALRKQSSFITPDQVWDTYLEASNVEICLIVLSQANILIILIETP
jgi:hypothetical protein